MGTSTGAPIVQVAIDVLSVEQALSVASMAVRAGVDWIEVGTPLILFNGISAIGAIASAFPNHTIFADIKIVDGAKKYVVAAASQGARITSVCGVATDASVQQAIAGGRETGTRVCVDLYASLDPVARAVQAATWGADFVYLHYGGDQKAEDPDNDPTLRLIPVVKRAVDLPVGAVTFDADDAVKAIGAGADIVLIGHPFLVGPDSEAKLTDYVQRVRGASRG
jgi:3-hexulose-6-phosphate synthase